LSFLSFIEWILTVATWLAYQINQASDAGKRQKCQYSSQAAVKCIYFTLY